MSKLIGTSPSLQLGVQSLIGALGIATLLFEHFPGYDWVGRIMCGLGIDRNTAAGVVMALTALITCYKVGHSTIDALIEKYYSTSVKIEPDSMLFQDFFTWFEEQTAGLDLGRILEAEKVSRGPANGGDGDGASYMDYEYLRRGHPCGKQDYRLQYLSGGFRYFLYYRGHRIRIVMEDARRRRSVHGLLHGGTVSLRSYGRDPAILKELLEEVLRKSNARDQGRTIVFHAKVSPPHWVRALSRPDRSMERVVLEREQKESIMRDVEKYISPATAKWYANRGLPYRRGYLLYGPPGTGKTSLSMALAGHFNLGVYTLSLSSGSLTDDTLATLFSGLPSRCIVLLEDVDASNVKRTPDADAPADLSSTTEPTKPNVSLSGLLNAIDGAASCEGRILIMTTNHLERLDPALIRPGRVDLRISFKYASRNVIESLFVNLYNVDVGDREELGIPEGFPSEVEILELSREFGRVLPEGVFTPAEIQGLLLLHKEDPVAAIGAAGEWVREKLAEREAGGEGGGGGQRIYT